jgi:hypothetical protein
LLHGCCTNTLPQLRVTLCVCELEGRRLKSCRALRKHRGCSPRTSGRQSVAWLKTFRGCGAQTTSSAERKEIMRQGIERVVVEAEGKSERVRVRIKWTGGRQATGILVWPVIGFERLSYYPQLWERVRQLASQRFNSTEIARRLDEEGYRTPNLVEGFGEQGVKEIVRRLGLSRAKGPRKGANRLLESNELITRTLAWTAMSTSATPP